MSRPYGSKNADSETTKQRIEQAFKTVNGKKNAGLIALEKNHPAIFYALVAKTIPAAVAVSVTHEFNMGKMMALAQDNLRRLVPPSAPDSGLVDITPDNSPVVSDKVLPDKVAG